MVRMLDLFAGCSRAVIAVLLAVMVVLVFGNVVLRYGFNSGITVSEELSRWLFVWMTFLGAVVALQRARAPGHRQPGRGAAAARQEDLLRASATLLMLCAVLADWSAARWQQTVINWDTAAPVIGLSMALVLCRRRGLRRLAGVIIAARAL